jgi:hypothetical protein
MPNKTKCILLVSVMPARQFVPSMWGCASREPLTAHVWDLSVCCQHASAAMKSTSWQCMKAATLGLPSTHTSSPPPLGNNSHLHRFHGNMMALSVYCLAMHSPSNKRAERHTLALPGPRPSARTCRRRHTLTLVAKTASSSAPRALSDAAWPMRVPPTRNALASGDAADRAVATASRRRSARCALLAACAPKQDAVVIQNLSNFSYCRICPIFPCGIGPLVPAWQSYMVLSSMPSHRQSFAPRRKAPAPPRESAM